MNCQKKLPYLIPRHFGITPAPENFAEIVFLGKANIRAMYEYWNEVLQDCVLKIAQIHSALEATIDPIYTARKHKDLVFSDNGLHEIGPDKTIREVNTHIGPLRNSTTMNRCGWCRYSKINGASHYDEMHLCVSNCGIVENAGLPDERRRFDARCIFGAPDQFILEVRKNLGYKIKKLKKRRNRVEEKIEILLLLERQAEQKPAFVMCRPKDWFGINDKVVCHIAKLPQKIIPANFMTASVIVGFGWREGTVYVFFNEKVHSGYLHNGYGVGCRVEDPIILHDWEFEYLLTHPVFAKIWSKNKPLLFQDFLQAENRV